MKNDKHWVDGIKEHFPIIRRNETVHISQVPKSEYDVISAYREGADAAALGAHAFSCPYLNCLDNAAKYVAWMEGFSSYKGG